MTQYTGTQSSIGANYLNAFYSKLGPLDEYIIMQTGQYTYEMLVHRIPSGDYCGYKIERQSTGSSSSYGYYYDMTELTSVTWDYTVYNEMYVYSNIGYGTMSVLPVHEIMVCWSVTGLTCLLFLAVIFKGALFKCLRKK